MSDPPAGESAVHYSYRYAAAGAAAGLAVSLGMIPADGGLLVRAGIGVRFAAIGALFAAWVVFWLNQCGAAPRQRIVRKVLLGLSPLLALGVLAGGLIGTAGVFVNLFVPVFVVLPPLVYGVRREWRACAAALAAVAVLTPVIVRSVLRESPEETERRRRFCAEWYDADEAVWDAAARVCERTLAGELRDRLEGATVRAPGPDGGTPVTLRPEYDDRRRERFARGAAPPDAAAGDADVVVTIRRSDRITVAADEPSLFLAPFHVTRPRGGGGGDSAAYLGVFRASGGLGRAAEHVGSEPLAAGAQVARVSATLIDAGTRTWEARVRYAGGRPDDAFTFTAAGRAPRPGRALRTTPP